jgi:uncharacterized protein (DUF433 family)
MDWSECTAVERDPKRVSGAWVFRASRIPLVALFQNLADGVSLGELTEIFAGVTTEQVRMVFEHVAQSSKGPELLNPGQQQKRPARGRPEPQRLAAAASDCTSAS